MAKANNIAKELGVLGWLADAPMFIDSDLVSSFYDAVVKPEGEKVELSVSKKTRNNLTRIIHDALVIGSRNGALNL